MAISDVQQALINVGSIAKQDLATVLYTPGTAESQVSWFGQRGFAADKYALFEADPNDTNGTLIDFAFVTPAGAPAFTVGTIEAYDANSVVFEDTGAYYLVSTIGLSNGDSSLFPITDLSTTGPYTPPPQFMVCFAEGTRIRTERGDVAVEDLVEGDHVRVLDGGPDASRPVVWIGQREVNLASHPDPFEAQPVRIRRDAFAPGVPNRDLLVSPDHAVFVNGALIPDGVLIPARLLINGASIVRETRLSRVRYFHVELDRHSIIFSDNLPSESYLDTGNRSFFQNGGSVIDLNVGFVAHRPVIARDTDCCRPFVYAAGSVQPVWKRLAERAAAVGYIAPPVATTRDPAPRIEVNGCEIKPIRSGEDVFSFLLPPGATEVRLLSNAARPCDAQPWIEDHRVLGVSVSRIRVRTGLEVEDLALDGPAVGDGWWDVEQDGIELSRWTKGDAVLRLPQPLAGSPEALGSTRMLELKLGGDITYLVGRGDATPELAAIA